MFFKDLIYYATYLSPLLLLLGLIVGGLYYKYLSPQHKTLYYYLLAAIIIDILGRIFEAAYGNNLILIPVFGVLELISFSVLYYLHLLKTKSIPLLLIICAGLFYIIFEIWTVKSVDPKVFQSYSRVVDAFIIVLMSILFYLKKVDEDDAIELNLFSLNAAILIYFSLHLIFFLPINFLINESSQLKFYFWSVNLLVTLSFYLFLIRSIWKNGKTQK